MKRSYQPFVRVALSVLLLCCLLLPCVPAAPTASQTVPPILQACSQARVPAASFICGFPGNESAVVPDGPPYLIKCYDNSSTEFNQTIMSWKWDFGDGGTSTDQNPQHTYSDPSRYDIKLTVTTFCGSQYTNASMKSMSIYCSAPEPGFTTNVTEGDAPLTVKVTDTSLRSREDITRWTYWFDNTHSGTERNPVFTYTTPGTYTINQTVWKDCVQLGNSFYAPATRKITVRAPLAGSAVNGTAAPTGILTTAIPTAPAVQPSGVPAVTEAVTEHPVLTETPVPTTGTLSVSTQPDGASVYVDDILKGKSPVDIPDLSTGSHTLRFEREGYETMTMTTVILGGQTTSFSATLPPVSGGIAILPVIVLSLIVIGILVGGIFLYRRQKALNED